KQPLLCRQAVLARAQAEQRDGQRQRRRRGENPFVPSVSHCRLLGPPPTSPGGGRVPSSPVTEGATTPGRGPSRAALLGDEAAALVACGGRAVQVLPIPRQRPPTRGVAAAHRDRCDSAACGSRSWRRSWCFGGWGRTTRRLVARCGSTWSSSPGS